MAKITQNIEVPKVKTLFDHIKAITEYQDVDYFSTLSDADKKTWNNYMINRFLSMNMDWTGIISELDPYTTGIQSNPEHVYKLYINIIPQGRIFLKYVKSKVSNNYPNEVIDVIKSYFECSKKEAIENIRTLIKIGKKTDIESLLIRHGYSEKETEKLIKKLK